jgi:hypothetical protein
VERLILDTSALISLERGRAEPTDVLPDDDRFRERRSELVEGALERVEIIPSI